MTSHLEFYIQHGIAPVRYDLSNLAAHFQRREALYRTLGVLPFAIRGATVLEVAAGTGQNSLYLASLLPARLTLLEPNPAGIRNILASYKSLSIPHTPPVLIESKLETYAPEEPFEIVVCENWLGSSAHERSLLRKLAGFVAPRGVLVITCVSPTGLLANMVRRAVATKLTATLSDFAEKTILLSEAFNSHLATLAGMTRSVEDWVHDNMLNPAYFDLCLTVPMVVEEVGTALEAIGVSPDFRQDWRWFKTIHGSEFQFNANMKEQYLRNCHNFLDYRETSGERSVIQGRAMESAAQSFIDAVRFFEASTVAGQYGQMRADALARELDGISGSFNDIGARARAAMGEAAELLRHSSLSTTDVARASEMARWFGRETIYLSLERRQDGI